MRERVKNAHRCRAPVRAGGGRDFGRDFRRDRGRRVKTALSARRSR